MSEMVRCSFKLRVPAAEHPGMFIYAQLWVDGWHGDGTLRTSHPPAVGDTVWLDSRGPGGELYRVLMRDWAYPVYGSDDWPRGERNPVYGPILRCLVEPAKSFIQDEAPDTED